MTKALKLLTVAAVTALGLAAQQTPPNNWPEVLQPFYDASGNLTYACYAKQKKPTPTFVMRSDSSLTSIAVATNVATVTTASAHNLYVGARIVVSGATVVPALNATYTIATVPSSTTYTFTTSGVADATYNESTLQIGTYYPLLNETLWAIQVLKYDGSSNLITKIWAGQVINYTLACSDRTNY